MRCHVDHSRPLKPVEVVTCSVVIRLTRLLNQTFNLVFPNGRALTHSPVYIQFPPFCTGQVARMRVSACVCLRRENYAGIWLVDSILIPFESASSYSFWPELLPTFFLSFRLCFYFHHHLTWRRWFQCQVYLPKISYAWTNISLVSSQTCWEC